MVVVVVVVVVVVLVVVVVASSSICSSYPDADIIREALYAGEFTFERV